MVILGHVSASAFLNNYFSSFYMPAFFIISGYTMKEKLKVSLPEHLLHKAKMLLLPYFLFSICWIAFSYGKSFFTHAEFSVLSAFVSIFFPYSGRIGGSTYIYWFLPCLFLSYLVFALIIYLPHKQKILGGGLWGVYLVFGQILTHGSILSCAAMAVLFISLGYMMRNFKMGANISSKALYTIVVLTLVNAICICLNKNTLDFSSAAFGNVFLFILGAFAGTAAWAIISQFVSKVCWVNQGFAYIGKNSLAFYTIHFFFNSIAGILEYSVTSFFTVLILTASSVVVYNKIGLNNLFQGNISLCQIFPNKL